MVRGAVSFFCTVLNEGNDEDFMGVFVFRCWFSFIVCSAEGWRIESGRRTVWLHRYVEGGFWCIQRAFFASFCILFLIFSIFLYFT